jgi:prevent-host-death family protein
VRGHAAPEKQDFVVNIHEAKTHFSKILRRVQSGQAVIIAKASKPIARVVPLREARQRHLFVWRADALVE